MASKVDWSTLSGYKPVQVSETPNTNRSNKKVFFPTEDFFVTIEASCPTGFEIALDAEIRERFSSSKTVKHQGRVFFDVQVSQIDKVIQLRCMDNACVLIGVRNDFDFSGDIELCLKRINGLLNDKECNYDNNRLSFIVTIHFQGKRISIAYDNKI